ncbi:MAG TPA: NAD(P)/FAD-dependent oxidoreductase [Actinomycetota bacterium]|nr:NAD(P)/FAD-dependent oxidoreductase [Actinomycetota bacterium]
MDNKPAIVSVCRDQTTSRIIEDQLRQRYSTDYDIRILAADSDIEEMQSECRGAALLMTDVMWGGAAELLAIVKEREPATGRLGVAPWGQPVASSGLQELLHDGLIEYFVILPKVLPDEQFHRTVTEFLEEWSRDNGDVFEVVRLIDRDGSAAIHRLRDLLTRNYVPHGFYTSDSAAGRTLLAENGLDENTLPAVVMFDGVSLVDPTERELADAITGQAVDAPTEVDVLIVGGGPAGLAAAVYASSEGLSAAVLEREAIGGQAGTTSLIRNYLGFNRGISGQELASRAFRQAWAFGTNVRFIREATSLTIEADSFQVTVSDGTTIQARSVILAQGVSYRRLGIQPLENFVGAGVYYGAAVTEAPATRGQDVFVVGGGNSAGQASVHLSRFALRVSLLVRGNSLADSMSEYLIAEIEARPNISVEFGCQIVDGGGDTKLEWIQLEDLKSGARRRADAQSLFVLIGAVPATDWLPLEIDKDEWGFIVTGDEVAHSQRWPIDRPPLLFETSLPGVFAVGDVRRGSVKRVASAVGEGSAAIQSCHAYLSGSVTSDRAHA